MKIAIIEDEAVAAQRLEKLILSVQPEAEIMAKLPSVEKSIAWLREHSPDLLFVDIQLSDGLSFTIFEQLNITIPVIFVTAYNEFAIKAFSVNSVDYLLKPVNKKDLAQALDKFNALRSAFTIDFERVLTQIQGQQPDYRRRFLIQVGETFYKIEVDDIACFHTYQHGVYLRTREGRSHPIDFTLDSLEESLDPDQFFRLNRQCIIHTDAITSMTALSRNRIHVELTGVKHPSEYDKINTDVSVERAADFRSWLNR